LVNRRHSTPDSRQDPVSIGSTHREQVVHQGSQMSGGLSETVAAAVGLETMAQRMSALIAKQYMITYGPGGGGTTASRRKVTVGRKGLRVLAPVWNPR
jgi:hypothetical protein